MAHTANFSGVVLLSGQFDTRVVQTFNTTLSGTHIVADVFVLPFGVSNYTFIHPEASAPHMLLLTATTRVRVNFPQRSATSHASAGFQFQDLFAVVGSALSNRFSALYFANSGTSNAIVHYYLGHLLPAPAVGDYQGEITVQTWNEEWEPQQPTISTEVYAEAWEYTAPTLNTVVFTEAWES